MVEMSSKRVVIIDKGVEKITFNIEIVDAKTANVSYAGAQTKETMAIFQYLQARFNKPAYTSGLPDGGDFKAMTPAQLNDRFDTCSSVLSEKGNSIIITAKDGKGMHADKIAWLIEDGLRQLGKEKDIYKACLDFAVAANAGRQGR
jgi:hypothetical protein